MKEMLNEWKRYVNEQEGLESKEETKTVTFPKLRISEQWGTPGAEDRKIIEMFTSRISGNDLSSKIASLQSMIKDCDEACVNSKDVGEILAGLVFLDSLASVVYDFNDKTGGFLFESLLSALLGGKSRQVPTPGGPNQAIEDIVDSDGETPLSLKFFFSGASQYVKGSHRNLNRGIEKYQRPIRYIIALKNRSGDDVLNIDFYGFDVGNENYPGDFNGYGADLVGGYRGASGNGLPVRRATSSNFKLGTLDLGSRKEMKERAQKYVDRLGENLFDIYSELENLTNNVNRYFLNSPEAKDAALDARKNANSLKADTEKL